MGITKGRIKGIKKLHDHNERTEKGRFLIEGVRLLEEAVKEGASLEEVFYTGKMAETGRGKAILKALEGKDVLLCRVTEKVMEGVAGTETPQGILAVVRQLNWQLKDIVRDKGIAIVACGLQDPGNLGTIVRTADAGGASGVITTGNAVDIYNPKVVRATMGSIFRMPVIKVDGLKETVSAMKEAGYLVVAATSDSKISYLDVEYRRPTAFLIGQEGSGLQRDELESADTKVFIPMRKGVESLNAAISAGVLIYEALRQSRRP